MSFVGQWPSGGMLSVSRHRPPATRPRLDPLVGQIADEVPSGGIMSAPRTWKRMSRRAQYKRKRRGRRRIFRRRAGRAVAPFSVLRKFKTSVYFSTNPGGGTIAASTVKLNDCLDPLSGLGSVKPLGFTEYAALYNKYCVVAWKATLEASSTDNTNPVIMGMSVVPDNSSTLTSYHHYREMPGTTQRYLTPDIDKNFMSLKGSCKRYLLPQGGRILSDDECTALTSATPSKLLYLHVYGQAADASADPATIHNVLTITQYVRFFSPKIPARV